MLSYIKGFFDCFSGFGLLFKPGIKRFVFIPFVTSIILFSAAIFLLSDQLSIWLEQILPSWLVWVKWLIWPLLIIAMFYTFTIVANLIAAPFNSVLSAKIEAMLTGKKPEDINSDGFIKLMARTIKSEIKKILYAIKWFIPLIIITMIPAVNFLAPFLWILFGAWFFALEYIDYPIANRGQFFDEVKSYNQKNRMRTLGFGTAVFIMTSIPIVNFFAMPIAVAGATKLTTKVAVE